MSFLNGKSGFSLMFLYCHREFVGLDGWISKVCVTDGGPRFMTPPEPQPCLLKNHIYTAKWFCLLHFGGNLIAAWTLFTGNSFSVHEVQLSHTRQKL